VGLAIRYATSEEFLAVAELDGAVSYRVKNQWDQGEPDGDCEIVDYVPGSPDAHAALWQTLLGLDLGARINSYRVPLDDPLPDLLTNPRAVDTTHWADGVWVRPTDVPALLGGRRYGVEVDCVLGGVRFGRLRRAGRVSCPDDALARRLELALLADREPFPMTQF